MKIHPLYTSAYFIYPCIFNIRVFYMSVYFIYPCTSNIHVFHTSLYFKYPCILRQAVILLVMRRFKHQTHLCLCLRILITAAKSKCQKQPAVMLASRTTVTLTLQSWKHTTPRGTDISQGLRDATVAPHRPGRAYESISKPSGVKLSSARKIIQTGTHSR